MANTTLMRQVADWIDENPSQYRYMQWDKCVAGITVRLDGTSDFVPGHSARVLTDQRFQGEHVFNRVGEVPFVHIGDRAQSLLDISDAEAGVLFLNMADIDRDDPHVVTSFVRQFADKLDMEG